VRALEVLVYVWMRESMVRGRWDGGRLTAFVAAADTGKGRRERLN
jgi:hypothetical protein